MGKVPPVATHRLNTASPVPLYYQLQELLKEEIEGGQWGAQDQLPSESQLEAMYGVSRTVVRQALAVLENDGQIRRHKGKGSFVNPPKVEVALSTLSAFPDKASSQFETKVLSREHTTARGPVAQYLGLQPGAEVERYTVLQSVGEMPIGLGYHFVAPEAVASSQQQSRFWLETSLMSEYEAQQFGARVGLPVFLVRQVSSTTSGDPVSFSRIVYRSDAVQIVFEP